MKRAILAAGVLAGCASGRAGDHVDADTTQSPDSKVFLDGAIEPTPDAHADAAPSPDAAVPPDAAILPPDAYQCTVMTRQLLTNPVFDLTPVGTGWVQQNIDNAYPIVTADDGIPEQSAPYKAWMGGIVSGTDVLYQDITVPAGTTQLVFTGYYEVRTAETGSTVYDTGQVGLTQTNGTPIVTIKTLNNASPTTAWTAINFTVPQNLSNQTVRLRFTSTNDSSFETSFYFDTLSLTATYCQ